MRAIRYIDQREDHKKLLRLGKYQLAFNRLQELAPLHGDSPEFISDLTDVMWLLGEEKQVFELLHILVTRFPEFYKGWLQLGIRMGNYGESEQAINCLKKAIELNPDTIIARTELAKYEHFSPNSAQARFLRKQLDKDHPEEVLNEVMIALAAAEARSGSPVKAFGLWKRINERLDKPYDSKLLLDMVTLLDERAASLPPAAPADPQMPRFLFICGMPRSGTTITETVLANHPDAYPLEESPALSVAMQKAGLPDFSRVTREKLEKFTPPDAATLQQIRADFLAELPQNAPRDKLLITKTPADVFGLWLANAILPDLRVLHMERHPLDVGLSNYQTNFLTLHRFHTSFEGIADVTQATWRMRDINARLLGPQMRVQSYRAMIDDREAQIGAILAHAGLDPARHSTTPDSDEIRAVRTASVHQVRKGLNRKGLGKWRKFEKQLAPLVDLLGGPEAIAAWEAQDAACAFKPG